ncbi:28636_t:CDS:2, partial [Gigaspora margarita]
ERYLDLRGQVDSKQGEPGGLFDKDMGPGRLAVRQSGVRGVGSQMGGRLFHTGLGKRSKLCMPTFWHGTSSVDAQPRVQSPSVTNSPGMGFGPVVANVPRSAKRSSGITTSNRNYRSGTFGAEGTLQESGLEVVGSKDRMVKVLMDRANILAYCAIDKDYRKRLVEAMQLFESFCKWTKDTACPASVTTIKAFLGWLELAGMSTRVQEYLGAI